MFKKKFLIFIPAYNVEKKILHVLKIIPKNIFNDNFITILIIYDCSKDNTKYIVEEYLKVSSDSNTFQLIKNEKRLGYGGVQKVAFRYAIKNNFDYVIMFHGINSNTLVCH